MSDVTDTYYGYTFSVEFIEDGYLLTYSNPSYCTKRQRSFDKWEDLVSFLKETYSEKWP